MPYMLGAVERVERGESKELIDAAAVAFGMPMGPIELMDTVGLDVGSRWRTSSKHAGAGGFAVRAAGQREEARPQDRRGLLQMGRRQGA